MSAPASSLWGQLVDTRKACDAAAQEFLSKERERLTVLRQALKGPDRNTALWIARSLNIQEQQQLLPELVHLARSVHGPFEAAWNLIAALPRAWLLKNIETEIDDILKDEQEDDYWMLLQLAERLDRELAMKIARRALTNSNPDIQELGEERVRKWSEDNGTPLDDADSRPT